MAEQFIDAGEVARRLGIDRETVLKWAGQGKIPCIRQGQQFVRFDWDEVLAVLRKPALTTQAGGEAGE